VISRSFLKVLAFALPVCLVVFSVLMGGMLLARATQDELAARVLQWVGVAVLLAAVADLILLVCVLGLKALGESPPDSDDQGE